MSNQTEAVRYRAAIKCCLKWANGRQSEWGDRAENAFSFLEHVLHGVVLEAPEQQMFLQAVTNELEDTK